MVTPVNSDKTLTHRTETPIESRQLMPSSVNPQATAGTESQSQQVADSQMNVETARQLYHMENHRASVEPGSVNTQEQARSLLGQILQQFTANPKQSLEAHTAGSPVALTNLLERAPG